MREKERERERERERRRGREETCDAIKECSGFHGSGDPKQHLRSMYTLIGALRIVPKLLLALH